MKLNNFAPIGEAEMCTLIITGVDKDMDKLDSFIAGGKVNCYKHSREKLGKT